MDDRARLEKAIAMQEEYDTFLPFYIDAMRFLGFSPTWVQADIANFMDTGPQYLMCCAQRGEAKTTTAGLFGLWSLVRDPKEIIMVVGPTKDRSKSITTEMFKILHTWDLLDYLRPNVNKGDQNGAGAFDVHYVLKGINKMPSVFANPVFGTMTGARAGITIADDIETIENAMTSTAREKIQHKINELVAVNSNGRIIFLGTPQTKNSVYESFPARGVEIRVWPGRYPGPAQLVDYAGRLAPSIQAKLEANPNLCTGGGLDGSRGQPVDPDMFGEEALQKKELQGAEFFELQYMLNVKLADESKQQLKLRDLMVIEAGDKVPESLDWGPAPDKKIITPRGFPLFGVEMFRPANTSGSYVEVSNKVMTVDPASEGGDEVAFACGGVVGPFIHILDWGGLKGGMSEENMTKLIEIAVENKCDHIILERNLGGGIATKLLASHYAKMVSNKAVKDNISVSDQNSSGQKEKRIIDCIGPILARHRMVMHMRALERDTSTLQAYSSDKRVVHSGFAQMDSITKDRGSLAKDDRIDALEQLCRKLSSALLQEEGAEEERQRQEVFKEFLRNPSGAPEHLLKGSSRMVDRGKGPAYFRRRFGG